jgi:hypothetical protein
MATQSTPRPLQNSTGNTHATEHGVSGNECDVNATERHREAASCTQRYYNSDPLCDFLASDEFSSPTVSPRKKDADSDDGYTEESYTSSDADAVSDGHRSRTMSADSEQDSADASTADGHVAIADLKWKREDGDVYSYTEEESEEEPEEISQNEEAYVGVLVSIFQVAYPKTFLARLELEARKAVARIFSAKRSSVEYKAIPPIAELASCLSVDEKGNLNDMADILQEWKKLALYRDDPLRRQDHNHATERAGPNQCTKLSASEVHECRVQWNMKVIQNSVSKLISEQHLDDALCKCAGHIAVAYVLWESGLPCQWISEEGLRNNADITQPTTIQNDLDDMITFFGAVGIQMRYKWPAVKCIAYTPGYLIEKGQDVKNTSSCKLDRRSSTERSRAIEHGSPKASGHETMGSCAKPRVPDCQASTHRQARTHQHGRKRQCLPQFSIAKTW